MENPIKMDDLGVTLFLETPICSIYKLHQYSLYHINILNYIYQDIVCMYIGYLDVLYIYTVFKMDKLRTGFHMKRRVTWHS